MTAPASPRPRLERDAVLAELRAGDVVTHFAIKSRTIGDEIRVGICPACGPRSRKDSVAINLVTGRWVDHAHGCAGDLLALVAGLCGLDVRRDFERVLEIAADIARVGPNVDPEAVKRALEQRAAEQRAAEDARAKRQQAAIHRAGLAWRELARHHSRGERYLAIERGLDVDALLRRDLVRFAQAGDPAVALWSSAGTVRNVVRRALDGDTKVLGMAGCPTSGTLVGRVVDLARGMTVVLTEGVIDTLTACLAWPDALVLGAHGAAEMPTIAKVIAPRVAQLGGELLICGHNDPPRDGRPGVGQERADQAMVLALEAGLVTVAPDQEPIAKVRHVPIGEHKDLNDAFRAFPAGSRP